MAERLNSYSSSNLWQKSPRSAESIAMERYCEAKFSDPASSEIYEDMISAEARDGQNRHLLVQDMIEIESWSPHVIRKIPSDILQVIADHLACMKALTSSNFSFNSSEAQPVRFLESLEFDRIASSVDYITASAVATHRARFWIPPGTIFPEGYIINDASGRWNNNMNPEVEGLFRKAALPEGAYNRNKASGRWNNNMSPELEEVFRKAAENILSEGVYNRNKASGRWNNNMNPELEEFIRKAAENILSQGAYNHNKASGRWNNNMNPEVEEFFRFRKAAEKILSEGAFNRNKETSREDYLYAARQSLYMEGIPSSNIIDIPTNVCAESIPVQTHATEETHPMDVGGHHNSDSINQEPDSNLSWLPMAMSILAIVDGGIFSLVGTELQGIPLIPKYCSKSILGLLALSLTCLFCVGVFYNKLPAKLVDLTTYLALACNGVAFFMLVGFFMGYI